MDQVEEKVINGNAAFTEAMLKEPPKAFTRNSIILYLACLVGFLCSTMNGYDGSLFNNLTANNQFLRYFHGENTGIWAGIVSSMYQIGGVVALPFVGPALDTWGRKWGMVIGATLVIVGTVVQGTGHSIGQFEGGRFLLGFGVSI